MSKKPESASSQDKRLSHAIDRKLVDIIKDCQVAIAVADFRIASKHKD
jgi:hypothetical protein